MSKSQPKQHQQKQKILLAIGKQENKKILLPLLKKIPLDKFAIFATDHTSKFLTEKKIDNQLVYKVSNADKNPNIADLLLHDDFDLIINIPTHNRHDSSTNEYTDGRYIRSKAVEHNITLITDMEVAELYLKSLKLKSKTPAHPSQSPPAEPFTSYYQPLYDISKSYDFNYDFGPFFAGVFPEYKEPKKKKELLGFKVNSLFGVPAGPLLNGRWVKTYADLGFDILTYKTVRTTNHPCHKPPNIVFIDDEKDYDYDPKKPAFSKEIDEKQLSDQSYNRISITNSFGVPSKEPDVWQEDVKRLLPQLRPGQLLIVSVMATANEDSTEEEYLQDFVNCAVMAEQAGAEVIEVNLSCPNLGGQAIFSDLNLSKAIVKNVRKALEDSTKLLAKIGFFRDKKQCFKFIDETSPYLDGYTAINTVPKQVFRQEGEQALPGKTRLRAGTCGAVIKKAGLSVVELFHEYRQKNKADYVIIGVGGVMTPEDYEKYLKAGADAVQAATGPMWNPYLAYQIKKLAKK